ncbi:MAG: DUF2178 domain-containing protein [Solirubrobacteraceae bacterium]|nr:DUF2178 domain-containing protein [Solirubrobacteraceae bacterium]
MKLDRPTLIRLAYLGIAVAFLVIGFATGEIENAVLVAAVVLATWAAGELMSRRGSALGDEIVGRGDERVEQISRDAALGTVYTLSAAALGYMVYGFTQERADEQYMPVLVLFSVVWVVNYAFARWRPHAAASTRTR